MTASSSINDLLVCSVWPGETLNEAQIKKSGCDELKEIFSSNGISNGMNLNQELRTNLYIEADIRYISRTATHGLCIDLDCVKQARRNNYQAAVIEPVKTATVYEESIEHKLETPKREQIPIHTTSNKETTSQENVKETIFPGEIGKRQYPVKNIEGNINQFHSEFGVSSETINRNGLMITTFTLHKNSTFIFWARALQKRLPGHSMRQEAKSTALRAHGTISSTRQRRKPKKLKPRYQRMLFRWSIHLPALLLLKVIFLIISISKRLE